MENVEGNKLKKRGPPPFLRKIFDIVEDSNTNELISWGQNNRSFIVWDQFKFCSTILPEYFTHNNFSSFIYQLNSYGFKKVDYNRWEYANTWFRAGEKQLLCKIKRRTKSLQKRKQNEVKQIPFMDPKKLQLMEEEIEYLEIEHKELENEIQGLRKNLAIIGLELGNIKPKEENEMLDFVLKAFVKSQEKFGNNDEQETSDMALCNPSSFEDSVLIDHENGGEGELTQSQLKILLELKERIPKQSI